MRTTYPLEAPPERLSGRLDPWVEIVAWLVGFALLLAAPCAPEPPLGAAPDRAARGAVSAPAGR